MADPEQPAAKPTGPLRPVLYAALYPNLVTVAREHGYALAIHGSVTRDFDLIAVPWMETASDPLALIQALKRATGGVTHAAEFDHHWPDCSPTEKPHGRKAYSIHLSDQGMYGAYLDVSVMPRATSLPSVPQPPSAPAPEPLTC